MARVIDKDQDGTNLIGRNVRMLRKDQRMSQKKLSNKLELMGVYVCRGSISRIENQCRTVTDIELDAIARALDVDIKELFITVCAHMNPKTKKSTLRIDSETGIVTCTRCGQKFTELR